MKHDPTVRSLMLMLILAPLLALSGCFLDSDDDNNFFPIPANAAVVPGINPAFDSITQVAVSTDPGGAYDDVLVEDTDYTYDLATEVITITGSVATGGSYARITGLATVTGTQSSYKVYTYVAGAGDEVAANELTSQAVALVVAGDAANFAAALGSFRSKLWLAGRLGGRPGACRRAPGGTHQCAGYVGTRICRRGIRCQWL